MRVRNVLLFKNNRQILAKSRDLKSCLLKKDKYHGSFNENTNLAKGQSRNNT